MASLTSPTHIERRTTISLHRKFETENKPLLSSTIVPLKTFTCFSDLPQELRDHIWTLALREDPRVILLVHPYRGHFHGQYHIPPKLVRLSLVCPEAEATVLRHFLRCRGGQRAWPMSVLRKPIRDFNPDNTVICLLAANNKNIDLFTKRFPEQTKKVKALALGFEGGTWDRDDDQHGAIEALERFKSIEELVFVWGDWKHTRQKWKKRWGEISESSHWIADKTASQGNFDRFGLVLKLKLRGWPMNKPSVRIVRSGKFDILGDYQWVASSGSDRSTWTRRRP